MWENAKCRNVELTESRKRCAGVSFLIMDNDVMIIIIIIFTAPMG